MGIFENSRKIPLKCRISRLPFLFLGGDKLFLGKTVTFSVIMDYTIRSVLAKADTLDIAALRVEKCVNCNFNFNIWARYQNYKDRRKISL